MDKQQFDQVMAKLEEVERKVDGIDEATRKHYAWHRDLAGKIGRALMGH